MSQQTFQESLGFATLDDYNIFAIAVELGYLFEESESGFRQTTTDVTIAPTTPTIDVPPTTTDIDASQPFSYQDVLFNAQPLDTFGLGSGVAAESWW